MQLTLPATRLGIRNSTTRLPFRYGKACLTRCPQVVLGATIESGGRRREGFSGDCLPPGWFDKSPQKDFAEQIDDMLSVFALARQVFAEELAAPRDFFSAWLAASERVHATCRAQGQTPLLASFGVSLLERALLDAMARAADVSFAVAVRDNLFGIDPGAVDAELAGLAPRDWLPATPLASVDVRHTVGLSDPLTAGDIPAEERLNDGFPQALEQYVERSGIRYFKVKVANRLDDDRQRLATIAAIIERHRGEDYRLTLDGNEQYERAEEFEALLEALRSDPRCAALLENTLLIEQPLERRVALDAAHGEGIRRLSSFRPVIIDESDGTADAYRQALELGYRGVSSKNCKGPLRSLLSAGLTWLRNGRQSEGNFVMSGEDLCSVGIVPVQADLCLAATLGLTHVERNGHHYHPGLSYLPAAQAEAALEAHGDLYARQQGVIAPHLVDGRLQIGSLQCAGFGFAVEPDFETMQTPETWEFASLGL